MSELSPSRLREHLRAEGNVAIAAFEAAEEVNRTEVFLRLRPAERVELLRRLPDATARRLLEQADSTTVARVLEALDLDRARALLSGLQPDDAADIVLRMSEEIRAKLLGGLAIEEEVRRLLQYPEGTAGSLMNTRYVSVPEVVTVARATDLVRKAARAETVNYIYVVDLVGRLVGTLSVRNLLVASPRALVSDVATKRVVSVPATATREEIDREFQTHKFLALPVVDEKSRIVGVVTFDDAMSALREEQEQFVYSVTGVDPREHLVEGMRAARGRVPWISATIAGGLLCAGIGTIFKKTIEEIVFLGLFIPLVLAIGESVSSQTAAIVMKTLLTGAVEKARLRGFLAKELVIGLLLGLYAAVAVGGLSLLWKVGPKVAGTVAGAVALSVMWAALLGVTIPYFLRRTKVDPSIASGPIVLLLADLSTLVIYLGGAQLILF